MPMQFTSPALRVRGGCVAKLLRLGWRVFIHTDDVSLLLVSLRLTMALYTESVWYSAQMETDNMRDK